MSTLTGRLAMRVEGDWWVAYYALPDKMEGAIEIGRIQMAAVLDPDRKQAFMALARDFVGEVLADAVGEKPAWKDPVAAPEHEKAGRA